MVVTRALAAGATLVALALAGCIYERWLARRRRHELAWSISLVLFAAGSLALWAGASLGWDAVTFRLFYLFGAVLNVPILALGTIYLLAGRRIGDRVALGVVVVGAFASGIILASPISGAIDERVLPQGSDVFGLGPRLAAAAASGIGALVVFAGALWSAARLLLGRARPSVTATTAAFPASSAFPRRVAAGNLLIALGTATLSASGLLNSVADEMQAFAITLSLGVSILFIGFLVTTSGPPQDASVGRLAPVPVPSAVGGEAPCPQVPRAAGQRT